MVEVLSAEHAWYPLGLQASMGGEDLLTPLLVRPCKLWRLNSLQQKLWYCMFSSLQSTPPWRASGALQLARGRRIPALMYILQRCQ